MTSASARAIAFVDSLDPAQLAMFARRFEKLAHDGGAFVLLAGAEIAIPPILTPVVLEELDRKRLQADSRLLVSAVARIARRLVESPASKLRELVFAPLSPFERDAMMHTYREADQLATARVDFLVGTDGVARALEINATIPAMQGYGDAIAAAYLRAFGEARGASETTLARAIDANGRNSDDLLHSLLAHHQRRGGGIATPQRIAIVARDGDSQGGELDHYVRRWTELGHEPFRVTPAEIRLVSGKPTVEGRVPDLFYRHVFLRRCDPESDFARVVLASSRYPIWNPPASQLELKAVLALASAALESTGGDLTDDERDAVERRVPWTRLLVDGETSGPDGARVTDLLSFTRDHATRLVLKRSWDYGGRGVYLGAELDEESSQSRLRELMGPRDRPYLWDELVAHAHSAGEAWVVQALVDVEPKPMLRAESTGPQTRSLYADLSAFVSLGNDVDVSGGAVRTSGGRIVNIQGGGGLAPLIRAEALARLLD